MYVCFCSVKSSISLPLNHIKHSKPGICILLQCFMSGKELAVSAILEPIGNIHATPEMCTNCMEIQGHMMSREKVAVL